MGCDTFVALPAATRGGATLFAKNSDRPPREAQRVVQIGRRRAAPGDVVRCQYLEIPDVPEAAAVVGSQPYWLWGFEHGVNEHRVAIGNETVFCKEPLGPIGLLGMDLVRLALERARTASEAVDVIATCIERHGQGGSGHVHMEWPYHNAFLVADPTSAWIVETSARHWVAKPVAEVGNVSNGLAIGAEWTRGAADVTTFAVGEGWWPPDAGAVDFAAAYNDDASVPPNVCAERRRRGGALLAESRGRATPAVMRAILRDHYDAGAIHRPRDFADPRYLSICMHGDPMDNTTASMVMELPEDPAALVRGWIALGSPCVGAFLPCYPTAPLPTRLAHADGEPHPESPWWRMRAILDVVESDFATYGPVVRRRWDTFEQRMVADAADVEDRARAVADPGPLLAAFMDRAVDEYLHAASELLRELKA